MNLYIQSPHDTRQVFDIAVLMGYVCRGVTDLEVVVLLVVKYHLNVIDSSSITAGSTHISEQWGLVCGCRGIWEGGVWVRAG